MILNEAYDELINEGFFDPNTSKIRKTVHSIIPKTIEGSSDNNYNKILSSLKKISMFKDVYKAYNSTFSRSRFMKDEYIFGYYIQLADKSIYLVDIICIAQMISKSYTCVFAQIKSVYDPSKTQVSEKIAIDFVKCASQKINTFTKVKIKKDTLTITPNSFTCGNISYIGSLTYDSVSVYKTMATKYKNNLEYLEGMLSSKLVYTPLRK